MLAFNRISNIFSKIIIISIFSLVLFNTNSILYAREPISFSGMTESSKDVMLSLTVAGNVSNIFFKQGDIVKKGAVILSLDNTLEILEVKRRKLLWKDKTELESAAARVVTMKSILDSTKELYNSTRSVSREELEKMQLEYTLAVAEYKRLEILEQREEIEYELARANLNKRLLISPIKGSIIEILVDEGEGVEGLKPLVHLVDTTKCFFICNIEERIGRSIKKGEKVNLQIQTGSASITKKGKIIFVSPVVDSASGLLEIKAEFDNKDGAVRPGVSGYLIF
jgi:RND family efflux transporter MFP subunit